MPSAFNKEILLIECIEHSSSCFLKFLLNGLCISDTYILLCIHVLMLPDIQMYMCIIMHVVHVADYVWHQ